MSVALSRSGRRSVIALSVSAALAVAALSATSGAGSSAAAAVAAPYRANDYADGQAMSILPPGENGLLNATDAVAFELGQRPAGSDDQLPKYANLLYGAPTLTDSTLSSYYDDESFGIAPGGIVRTEVPESGVAIYRDSHDVPHIYGNTDSTMAFGAGYSQAEDRLFLMDVLRHYGEGTLASFLGGSCEFEQMDHDELLLSPYTAAQATAQVDALPSEFGAQGTLARTMIYNYVAGVNAYISKALIDPLLLPADYAAAVPSVLPQRWTVADVVAVASLIGGILGKGGGNEIANAGLLTALQKQMGAAAGHEAFTEFKSQNDPTAPTTVVDKSFPYETAGTVDPATTAIPDSTTLTGGPVDTDPNCNLAKPNLAALTALTNVLAFPSHMSNALVVNANHSADGHPIAVFGPQTSYYAPQILAEEDLHSPDYDAAGVSFPGTGIVELGRGQDYAWSATSAGSDEIDQRLEVICNPTGGAPDPHGTSYLYNGVCTPMTVQHFDELALPKPAGVGAPALLNHTIYQSRHGVIQGWTTSGGKPVAVVNQRSTFNHDVDSVVGFVAWGQPARTHDVASWMTSAAQISFTFNWFYVDSAHTGYYTSGLDPIRPSNVDPNLPTWGTGNAEWQGFLPADQHVNEVDPAQGYFISWNNKPAPGFSAADDQYAYGSVYRSQLLVGQLQAQLAAHPAGLTRANVVQAMEGAASQDLDGVSVLPLLLQYLQGRSEPAGVSAMLAQLQSWIAQGSHRKKAAPGDTQYAQASAVAISDELMPDLIQALYTAILGVDGVGGVTSTGGAVTTGFVVLPMQWINTPNSGGAHLGSAYDGGYESYLRTTLLQLLGQSPADAFGPVITSRLCTGGISTCGTSIDSALLTAYNALVTANGSAAVATWTASTASKAANQTMPVYDAIQFRALGLMTQPAIDWQNRPTFQQVVEFPRHRP